MSNKEQLYEAFAELAYSVAMSDGTIEQIEIDTVIEASKGHEIQKNISTLFNSKNNEISVAQSFKNILDLHREIIEQDKEYPFLIGIIEKLSRVSVKDELIEDTIIGSVLESLKKKLL